jgi:hypothetical protein
MKRIFARVFLGAIFAFVMLYVGDYLVIRCKIWRNWTPFAQVTVQPYYAIHQKNGKTEYDSAPIEIDTCIHALFPHLGYSPCWYVNRHTEKSIDI